MVWNATLNSINREISSEIRFDFLMSLFYRVSSRGEEHARELYAAALNMVTEKKCIGTESFTYRDITILS